MALNESKNNTPSKKIVIPPIPLQIEPPTPERIADMVDDLVRIPEIMAHFRSRISEYAHNKYKFIIASEEQGKKREKKLQAILDNERLRDQEAGPPEKGWCWGTGCLEKINQQGKFHNIAVSGWTPPSAIESCANPDGLGDINYGCWLLAVCHDYYLVGKRPLIIDKAFAAQNPGIAPLRVIQNSNHFPQIAIIREKEPLFYPFLKDVHYAIKRLSEELEAETPKSQAGAGDFTFTPGQVLYMGQDLKLPTGFTIEIFKKLVDNLGMALAYRTLDNTSTISEASGQLKTAVCRIRKVLQKKKSPYQIITKRGESYLLSNSKGR